MRAMIVAYDKNRVIGNHGDIPWQGKMRGDMRYFRQMTSGHPMIMGRTTYELIHSLPNRTSIVVTHQDLQATDAIVTHSFEEAFERAEEIDPDLVFVIGGAQIYAATMDMVDTIYATEIDASNEGDAYFPAIESAKWVETKREHHAADDDNIYDYDFVTYQRADTV